MAKITKITAQKKPGYYNIFIGDTYSFSLHEDVLVKHRIVVGKELTQENINELKSENDYEQNYQKALNFIDYQMRSTEQVRRKLNQLKVTAEIAEQIIERLTANKFLDDQKYANLLAQEYFKKGDIGPFKIKQKLIDKGIPTQYIDHEISLLQQDEVTLRQQIARMIAKNNNKYSKFPARKAHEKLLNFLYTKGYPIDLIREVIDSELVINVDESSLLATEYAKQKNKINEEDPRKFKFKMIAKLSKAGFDFAEINDFLDQT